MAYSAWARMSLYVDAYGLSQLRVCVYVGIIYIVGLLFLSVYKLFG